MLLAKSADTEVNEAEHVVRYPAREYRMGRCAHHSSHHSAADERRTR